MTSLVLVSGDISEQRQSHRVVKMEMINALRQRGNLKRISYLIRQSRKLITEKAEYNE